MALRHTLRLVGATALFSLTVMAAPAFADPDCADHPQVKKCDDVNVGATPELDSLVLFGTGLLGAGGYALTRFRARRRHDEVESTTT
jgi:hypothetical protein